MVVHVFFNEDGQKVSPPSEDIVHRDLDELYQAIRPHLWINKSRMEMMSIGF